MRAILTTAILFGFISAADAHRFCVDDTGHAYLCARHPRVVAPEPESDDTTTTYTIIVPRPGGWFERDVPADSWGTSFYGENGGTVHYGN